MQFLTWTFDREVAEALRRCSLIDLIGVPYWHIPIATIPVVVAMGVQRLQ